MQDNRYAVEAIKDEAVPPEIIEKNLRFKMLEELEGVLFSGEMVAIKISKEDLPGNRYGGLIRYQAEVKQVRQVEYVHVPPAEWQPARKRRNRSPWEWLKRKVREKTRKAAGNEAKRS